MSFTNIDEVDDHIKSFLSPGDLIQLESVSKSNISTPYQWKKLGYENKDEFKKIVNKILTICKDTNEKMIIKKIILTGCINGQQAKEILKQDSDGKKACCSGTGIQTIALGIFSPSEIGSMEEYKRHYCLSKSGFALIRNGILNPDEIREMSPFYKFVNKRT